MPPLTRTEIDKMNTTQRHEHAQATIEEAGCHTFDWAYPIEWWKEFRDKTGFNHCSGEIVWGYGRTSIYGGPVALTIRAKEALEAVG